VRAPETTGPPRFSVVADSATAPPPHSAYQPACAPVRVFANRGSSKPALPSHKQGHCPSLGAVPRQLTPGLSPFSVQCLLLPNHLRLSPPRGGRRGSRSCVCGISELCQVGGGTSGIEARCLRLESPASLLSTARRTRRADRRGTPGVGKPRPMCSGLVPINGPRSCLVDVAKAASRKSAGRGIGFKAQPARGTAPARGAKPNGRVRPVVRRGSKVRNAVAYGVESSGWARQLSFSSISPRGNCAHNR